MEKYVCSICNLFSRNSFSAVLRHIGNTQRYAPNLSIRCGISSCTEAYNNFESFRSHVYRKHRGALHSSDEGSTGRDLGEPAKTSDRDSVELPSDSAAELAELEPRPHDINLKSMAALFLLKVREEYKQTSGCLDSLERGTVEWNSGMVEWWNSGMVERWVERLI